MKKPPQKSPGRKLSKADFESLAHFRYHLRRFLRLVILTGVAAG